MPALLVLLAFGEATAQEPPAPKAPPPKAGSCGILDAPELLARSYHFDRAEARVGVSEFPTRVVRSEQGGNTSIDSILKAPDADVRQGPSGGHILLVITKPDGMNQDDWNNSYAYGAAESERKRGDGTGAADTAPIGVSIVERKINAALLQVDLPAATRGINQEKWTVVAVLCAGFGEANKILGYGSTKISVVSIDYAWRLAIAVMALYWVLIASACYQLYRDKLRPRWDNEPNLIKRAFGDNRVAKTVWFALTCMNPLYISQDSLGYGSIARLQILLFTTVVGFVLLYVFIHSAVLASVSSTILLLLGVTLAGGTLGRTLGDWNGLSTKSRTWLIGTGILQNSQEHPRWSEIFETQGEIDVAKVQALLFTGLIILNILSSSYIGLANFYLPEQTIGLALISQGAYVVGKALPADSRKELEDDLEALRSAASAVGAKPAPGDPATPAAAPDAQKVATYELARSTARTTLRRTYADKFDADKFDEFTKDWTRVV